MDTVEALENAQSRGTFSVLAFIEQTAYPTTEVTVFQDVKSADEYIKAINKRHELEQLSSSDGSAEADLAKHDEYVAELGAKLAASALIFELRGMPPGVTKAITDPPGSSDDDSEELQRQRDNELIAKTIISVKNSKGEVDDHLWVAEDIQRLRDFLKEGEFGKLIKGVVEVNFNAAIFDQATDAGFSVAGIDVAA